MPQEDTICDPAVVKMLNPGNRSRQGRSCRNLNGCQRKTISIRLLIFGTFFSYIQADHTVSPMMGQVMLATNCSCQNLPSGPPPTASFRSSNLSALQKSQAIPSEAYLHLVFLEFLKCWTNDVGIELISSNCSVKDLHCSFQGLLFCRFGCDTLNDCRPFVLWFSYRPTSVAFETPHSAQPEREITISFRAGGFVWSRTSGDGSKALIVLERMSIVSLCTNQQFAVVNDMLVAGIVTGGIIIGCVTSTRHFLDE